MRCRERDFGPQRYKGSTAMWQQLQWKTRTGCRSSNLPANHHWPCGWLSTYIPHIHIIFRIVEINEYEGCAKNKEIRNGVHICIFCICNYIYIHTYIYVCIGKCMYLNVGRLHITRACLTGWRMLANTGATSGRTRRTTNRRQPDKCINNLHICIYTQIYTRIHTYTYCTYICAMYIKDSESWTSPTYTLCQKMDALIENGTFMAFINRPYK